MGLTWAVGYLAGLLVLLLVAGWHPTPRVPSALVPGAGHTTPAGARAARNWRCGGSPRPPLLWRVNHLGVHRHARSASRAEPVAPRPGACGSIPVQGTLRLLRRWGEVATFLLAVRPGSGCCLSLAHRPEGRAQPGLEGWKPLTRTPESSR